MARGCVVGLIVIVVLAAAATGSGVAAPSADSEVGRWALQPGFALAVDSSGYVVPTAIAAVRDPGPSPDDPLYFVTELGGTVKVVTRDRSVHTFTRIPLRPPPKPYPDYEGETGVGGICLDPTSGFVFVTYANADAKGVLRNHIVRYGTRPRTFDVRPSGQREIAPFLGVPPSAPSHQIGGCAVSDGSIVVGVGDGNDIALSRSVGQPLGKILRLTLDGDPARGNPFFRRPGPSAAVYAYGLRNPFGLAFANGDLYAVQNGAELDSFFRVEEGADYGWDGTDASVATNTLAVISPSVGPSQLTYLPAGSGPFPPRYRGQFYVATSTMEAGRDAGVMSVAIDPGTGRAAAPMSFVRFRGVRDGGVAAVDIGPDGLYFAPLIPGRGQNSSVLRVTSDPASPHPFVIGQESAGGSLVDSFGCRSCHLVNGRGGRTGPSLDVRSLSDRLHLRLNTDAYRAQVRSVDGRADEPFSSYRERRAEILAARPWERVRLWVASKLEEPRFDDPSARMPNLGLTASQAASIRDYLLNITPAVTPDGTAGERGLLDRAIDGTTTRRFAAGVVAGFVVAAVLAVALVAVLRRRSVA